MPSKASGLTKPERLYLRDDIRCLFEKSSGSFIAYPLRVVYRIAPKSEGKEPALSVLISVAKKRFKHAVNRNRVKRLIREAYRVQKSPLYNEVEAKGLTIHFALLMLDKELPSFSQVTAAMQKTLRRLEREVARYEQ